MNPKIEIPAIHDKDLRPVLERFGLAEKIDLGELRCGLCDSIITWDNIAALKVVNEMLIVYCNDPDCLENVSNQ